MATITASGMGSGMDINSLVSQLVAAERQPAATRLDRREAALQTQISAIGNFKGALSKFQSTLSGLKNADTFQGGAKATVANDKLFTASASKSAPAGSYSVKVEQLAQSQRLATSADHRFKNLTDPVGTGTLTFQFGTYGGTAANPTFTANPDQSIKTVTIDASNNTLSGVMKAINDAKIGVQASIVNDGGGYRLVLGSTATGAANSLKITAADGDGNHTDLAGLSLLAHDPTLIDGAVRPRRPRRHRRADHHQRQQYPERGDSRRHARSQGNRQRRDHAHGGSGQRRHQQRRAILRQGVQRTGQHGQIPDQLQCRNQAGRGVAGRFQRPFHLRPTAR